VTDLKCYEQCQVLTVLYIFLKHILYLKVIWKNNQSPYLSFVGNFIYNFLYSCYLITQFLKKQITLSSYVFSYNILGEGRIQLKLT